MRKISTFIVLLGLLQIVSAQQIEWNSARILLEIEKLSNTGSVLYIAAHPDDENTRLITYLANEEKVRTGYLSLTRGDGGQNLVGDEQGAYLGLIRTQELLAARRVDGGEQFFSRAVDFGYSKSATETFTKWEHDSLLSDVVWVIRNFKPNIIITRFPPDERAGHGQHTVSAMLADEAFTAAADPTMFPEQLKYVSVWQTPRLFLNNSTWWDKDLPNKIASGDKNFLAFDVGGYNSLLGKSYGEIAAESRTNHKSQGFGSTPTRGSQMEYLELKSGTPITNGNMFDGINTSWERYRQGSEIGNAISTIISDFNVNHPENSVEALLKVYTQLENMPTDQMIEFKKLQLQNIIVACLGIWLEPVAEKDMVTQGDELAIASSSMKRNDYNITLESISVLDNEYKVGEILPVGIVQMDSFTMNIPYNLTTTPYWLANSYTGLFDVPNQLLRGKAENDPALFFIYNVTIGDKLFHIKRAVVYKETDAVKGEIYKPIAIIPRLFGEVDQENIFIGENGLAEIHVTLTANEKISAMITVNTDSKASVEPKMVDINMDKGEVKVIKFTIKPENGVTHINFIQNRIDTITTYDEGTHKESIIINNTKNPLGSNYIIDYDHIPRQVVFEEAGVKLIKTDIIIPKIKIAYVEGAGDKVDESLQKIGLNITTITPESITLAELKKYDAIVIGVRAYNTSKALADNQNILMQYVNEGGLVITQYNTNWDSYSDNLGPYPFNIKRGRVTDENSPVDFLLPNHPVLNTPNKITKQDFDGWIQERGIYFAEDLAPEYATPLAFTDPNEKPQNGSLIIADYGKGAFIYTGIVFFRELPAGVPGAYRLFINLLSYKPLGK